MTPSGFRVVALVSAFNEADIIGAVIEHLIDQRVSVYLIDDGSSDDTVDIARSFLNRGVLGVETLAKSGQAFDWSAVLRRKQELARSLGADWVLHHDADEFRESPWPEIDLSEGIQLVDRLGYNAIDFRLLNFPPVDDTYERGDSIPEKFRFFEPGAAHDRVQIKCWKASVEAVDLVSSGGHHAEFAEQRVFPIPFLLRHYPIRSQRHGARKVLQERQARFVESERAKGWHVQYDAIGPDHVFLRNPDELKLYEAAAVRSELALSHRAALSALDALQAELHQAESRMHAQADAQASISENLAAAEHSLASTQQALQDASARLDNTHREVTLLSGKLAEANTGAMLLAAEIEALRASRSWRVTRPLRWAASVVEGAPREQPSAAVPATQPPPAPALTSLAPLSASWGTDRGLPIDRHFIHAFLAKHAEDIRGRVLEVKDSGYTHVFGGDKVLESAVLDIRQGNTLATIVGDLAGSTSLPEGRFDCFILTQTLHLIFDLQAAVRRALALLAPGGVLLATVPAVSRVSDEDEAYGVQDCWRLTRSAVERVFLRECHPDDLSIETHGNVRTCAAFLYGLATEELESSTLSFDDPLFPLIHCIRVVRRS